MSGLCYRCQEDFPGSQLTAMVGSDGGAPRVCGGCARPESAEIALLCEIALLRKGATGRGPFPWPFILLVVAFFGLGIIVGIIQLQVTALEAMHDED